MLDFVSLRSEGQNIRVHGNRFIQIDLDGGEERVHVWHDLVPFAQSYATPIHDHTFGFHSRILAGMLIDIRYRVYPHKVDAAPKNDLYDVLNYDIYAAQPRTGSDTALVRTGELVNADIVSVQAMPSGTGYMVRPREFHTTAYVGYAITRIKKTEKLKDVSPRVLCPASMQPDNEFERYKYSADELWNIVCKVFVQANWEKSKRELA